MTPESETPLAETIHEAKKDAKAALIFVIIMALVQLTSVAVYTFNAHQDRNEDDVQHSLDRQLEILENIFDRQDKKFKEIEYPLISLRVVLSEIINACDNKKLSSYQRSTKLSTLKDQRLKDKTALIQAYGASQIVFGENLFNKIKSFVAQIEDTEVNDDKVLCFLMTPAFNEKLRLENREISNLMYESMHKIEIKLNAVLRKQNIT